MTSLMITSTIHNNEVIMSTRCYNNPQKFENIKYIKYLKLKKYFYLHINLYMPKLQVSFASSKVEISNWSNLVLRLFLTIFPFTFTIINLKPSS